MVFIVYFFLSIVFNNVFINRSIGEMISYLDLYDEALTTLVKCKDEDIPIIIAISGKIGSGKDTVADMITSYFNSTWFKKRAFATRVKEVVATMTKTTVEQNISQEGKSYIPKGFNHSLGKLQQIIGEGMKPLLGTDIWANCLMNSEEKLPLFTVISDLRYKVEANTIRKSTKNTLLIRVDGDPVNIRKMNLANRDLDHISETDLDDYTGFDYHIDNSDITLHKLNSKVMIDIIIPFLRGLSESMNK